MFSKIDNKSRSMASEPQTGKSSSLPHSLSDIERGAGRYIFAISVLSESDTDRITTGELQEYLNVTPASVTEMVSKLADRGLVEYEKYQGVSLTDQGNALATEAGWRFCVVSTFFESVINMPVDDETAFDIGFVLPKDAVFSLRNLVDSACLGLCPASNDDSERCMV
jgi:DtxR family Mn-dependent transcriptional regulator